MEIDINSALEELKTKTLDQIQRETAIKWAGRALAARQLGLENNDQQLLSDSNEYVHEALEHAALVEDSGEFLVEIKKELTKD
jgi:hypothetical protein